MVKLLVTGSSGLIGSEVCLHFASLGWQIHGLDNNQRAVFFGSQGDTRWNQQRLQSLIKGFVHHEVDWATAVVVAHDVAPLCAINN